MANSHVQGSSRLGRSSRSRAGHGLLLIWHLNAATCVGRRVTELPDLRMSRLFLALFPWMLMLFSRARHRHMHTSLLGIPITRRKMALRVCRLRYSGDWCPPPQRHLPTPARIKRLSDANYRGKNRG